MSSSCNHEKLGRSPGTGQIFCLECGSVTIPAAGDLERARRWHDVGDMPPMHAPYYAAWLPSNGPWVVVRVAAGGALPHPATHWVEDLLGLPLV